MSNDVQATIKKVLPSIMCTIMAGGSIVKHPPSALRMRRQRNRRRITYHLVAVPGNAGPKGDLRRPATQGAGQTGDLQMVRLSQIIITAYT